VLKADSRSINYEEPYEFQQINVRLGGLRNDLRRASCSHCSEPLPAVQLLYLLDHCRYVPLTLDEFSQVAVEPFL
jgi:hypothetical protein